MRTTPPSPARHRAVHVGPADSFFLLPDELTDECVQAWQQFVSRPPRSRELAQGTFDANRDHLSTAWAGLCLAYHLIRAAEFVPAVASLERSRTLFEDIRDPRGAALAGVIHAYLDIMRGLAQTAAVQLEGIAKSCARSASAAPLDYFLIYHALALAYGRQGDVDRVLHHHYVNLMLLEQCGSPPPMAVVLLNLSTTLGVIDDWHESLHAARRAVALCQGFDNAILMRRAEINVALALRFLGRLGEATELLAKLRAEPFRDPGSDFALYINSAEAAAHDGDLDCARRWLALARQHAAPAGDAHEAANIEWIDGSIVAKAGDLSAAIALLERARDNVVSLKKLHVPLQPRIVETLAWCYAQAGEPARAFETYQRFHEAYAARLGYTTRARHIGDQSRHGVSAIRNALGQGTHAAGYGAEQPAEPARLNEALRRTLSSGREDQRGALASWSPNSIARLSAEASGLGVDAQFVGGIVEALHRSPDVANDDPQTQRVRVFTLGRFEIRVDGQPLRFGRKRPARLLELLKYLAVHGARELPEAQVADALWPDLDGDAALRALAVNLHRLRQLLGGTKTVSHRAHQIAVDSRRVWCDAIAFEWLLDQAAAAHAGDERHRLVERAVALYGGDLEMDEEREAWALEARERLRARFVGISAAQGARLAADGHWAEARAWYARGLERNAGAEELCLGLMNCGLALGHAAEGIAAYRQLERALARQSRAQPAAATRALYQDLLARIP